MEDLEEPGKWVRGAGKDGKFRAAAGGDTDGVESNHGSEGYHCGDRLT